VAFSKKKATVVDLSPRNYEFDLHCMSKETLPFILPVFITIGPDLDLGRKEKVFDSTGLGGSGSGTIVVEQQKIS